MVCSTQLSQSPQCALCTVCSVQHTAENKNFFSKSSFYTSNLFFCDRCFFFIWSPGLHGEMHTGETISAVCIPSLRQWLQVRKNLGCVQYTTEMISAVCITPLSRSPWCRGVHPMVETISPVCITPQRQTAHRRAKIKILTCLWLLLKRQSGEIISGVNTSITKEKIWRTKCGFSMTIFLSPQCATTLWLKISAKSKPNSKIF